MHNHHVVRNGRPKTFRSRTPSTLAKERQDTLQRGMLDNNVGVTAGIDLTDGRGLVDIPPNTNMNTLLRISSSVYHTTPVAGYRDAVPDFVLTHQSMPSMTRSLAVLDDLCMTCRQQSDTGKEVSISYCKACSQWAKSRPTRPHQRSALLQRVYTLAGRGRDGGVRAGGTVSAEQKTGYCPGRFLIACRKITFSELPRYKWVHLFWNGVTSVQYRSAVMPYMSQHKRVQQSK